MIPADFVFSTLPATDLVGMIKPVPPSSVIESAEKLSYRSMVYCYLELPVNTYSQYDAHYFPGSEVSFSRMSEPGNYSGAAEPQDRTGLCFEIPCAENDIIWNLSEEGVRDLVMRDLTRTGLPVPDVLSFTIRRKRSVYPVYAVGFKEHFERIDKFLTGFERLVSLGRQGLFVHDNTHHTIEMGIAAGRSLRDDLSWDEENWQKHRAEFEKHVVVD
jgi:protoporphyrinogen oxidase